MHTDKRPMDADYSDRVSLALELASIDIISIPALIVSNDFCILAVNKAALEILGPPKGLHCYEYLHAYSGPCTEGAAAVSDCSTAIRTEVTNRVSGRTFNSIHIPVSLRDGSHVTLMLFDDISEHRFIAKQATQLNRDYSRLFNRTQEGIFRVDVDGAFQAANPAFAEILGFDSVQALVSSGLTAMDFYESAEVRWQILERLTARGGLKNFETKIRTAQGQSRWVSISAVSIEDEEGKVVGLEGLMLDIDGRKNAEDLLCKRTEDAERAYREVQAYLDLITHDIANLLTPVVAHAEIMSLGEMSYDQVAEHSEFIRGQLMRSSRFISRVRMLSDARMSAGRGHAPLEIWEAMMTGLQHSDRGHDGRTLCLHGVPPPEPLFTLGGTHLSHVFEELFDNAVAQTDQPTVDVDVSVRPNVQVDQKPFHVIEIADRGRGIGPGTREQMMRQIHSCAEGARRGVITGLLFCASILSVIGGRIEIGDRVDSEPTKGAKVTLYLPVERGPS